jgi:3-(methylthio)propanoyl-CoA dehydrogenase
MRDRWRVLDYTPPLDDIAFALNLVGLDDLSSLPGFDHADRDTVIGLLAEYGRFVSEQLGTINELGDRVGAHVDPATRRVTLPSEFHSAYSKYVEAGWNSVAFPSHLGGGNFPWLVGIAMQEMMTSANMAFSLCPLLTQGAIDAIEHFGTETQRETYLAKMVSGEWTGTMNLTEPEAGSDVGALRTRAWQEPDGTWKVSGQKIYITYGDHQLTDNIVHLVLARVDGAPAGTKGISCFIVPMRPVLADGSLGDRNDVTTVSVEHKMGIHASPTCVLAFGDETGGASAELIGEVNAGMRTMFVMMNNARLSVGLQGVAVAERAYQHAYAHATSRVQGRPLGGQPSDAIIGHPDVRRMLMTMRSQIEATRLLCYLNAKAIDDARHQPDADVRAEASALADLLTPLSKGLTTDVGNEVCSLAIQIHGGMGFVEDTGVAQLARDIRIAPIYEGTNGIQAIDLVGRKLALADGAVVRSLIDQIRSTASALTGELADAGKHLADAAEQFARLSDVMRERMKTSPADALAAATPFARLAGITVAGWLMARQALVGDVARVATARFFLTQVLPQNNGLVASIEATADALVGLDPVSFASR